MQQQHLNEHVSQRRFSLLFGSTKLFLFRCLVVLWRVIEVIWGIIFGLTLGVLGNAMYTDLTQKKFVPVNLLFITEWVSANLLLTVPFLLALGVLTIAAYIAHQSYLHKASQTEQGE